MRHVNVCGNDLVGVRELISPCLIYSRMISRQSRSEPRAADRSLKLVVDICSCLAATWALRTCHFIANNPVLWLCMKIPVQNCNTDICARIRVASWSSLVFKPLHLIKYWYLSLNSREKWFISILLILWIYRNALYHLVLFGYQDHGGVILKSFKHFVDIWTICYQSIVVFVKTFDHYMDGQIPLSARVSRFGFQKTTL